MEWPHSEEVLFTSAHDWRFNACIGHWDSLGAYARRYKEAADLLVQSAMAGDAYVDSVIYPAAFLYRHFVELSLKDIIATTRRLEHRGRGYPAHHRLADLWDEAKGLVSEHYGEDAPTELANLDSCIDEFDWHDPWSDAFRYPTDRKGKPNLAGLTLINVRNLRETMDRVSNLLGCLVCDLGYRLDHCLEAERSCSW